MANPPKKTPAAPARIAASSRVPAAKRPAAPRKAAASGGKSGVADLDLLGEEEGKLMRFVVAAMSPGSQCPAVISPHGRPTLIDRQKMRNNWAKIPLRDRIAACRRVTAYNWFIRGVADLRIPVAIDGFQLLPKPVLGKKTPKKSRSRKKVAVPASAVEQDPDLPFYDFASLMSDIAQEDFVASNVVALWRKGETNPVVSILDGERIDYRSCGGLERITLQLTADEVMAADRDNEEFYKKKLGERMYKAYLRGSSITIIKGQDQEWDFEVMTGGKRNGAFVSPSLVSILDDLDFMELMKVGDWNLAWFRQQVIRLIKVGYAVTVGQGAGLNSVNMTDKERDDLGAGFSGLAGAANIPVNHTVNPGYLTVDPENFDPKTVASVINRLLFWGGIEAVALFGNFSQQNGAAPSLMRNLRIRVFSQRSRYENFIRRIFSAPEFGGLRVEAMNVHWSVKALYSIEELMALVSGTADGVASPQTRRTWLGLDDAEESQLMREAHERRRDYTPPFEGKQNLVASQFPEDFPGAAKATGPGGGGDEGSGGRPPKLPEA